MKHFESIILGFISAAGITAYASTLLIALLIGFVGAFGGYLFKLALDAIKKRLK